MYLFKGIFSDGEILGMDRYFWLALKPLIDDKVAMRVKEFWEQESSIPQTEIGNMLRSVVNLSKEVLEDTVMRKTFHLDVLDRGIVQKLYALSPANLIWAREDKIWLREQLQWLIDNKPYWEAYLEPRKKDDWLNFVDVVENLSNMVYAKALLGELSRNGVPWNPNVKRCLIDNQEAFFKRHEKRRSTRIDIVFNKALEIEQMLHGLLFEEELESTGTISFYSRRVF